MLRRTQRMLLSSVVPTRARASAVSFVVALAMLFVAMPASAAPMLAMGTGGQNPSRVPDANRDSAHLPNGISYNDCIADEVFTFTVTAAMGSFVTGTSTVQAWAATGDCTAAAARAPATNGTCQPVSDGVPIGISMSFQVRARDLVYAALANKSPGSGGLEPVVKHADASVCSLRTDPASTPMTIVFLSFTSGGGSLEAEANVVFNPMPVGNALSVDTVGPQMPTLGKLDIGDTLMNLNWTPASNAGDTSGFKVFVDPPPGQDPDAAPPLPDGATATVNTCDASTTTADSATPVDAVAPLDASGDAIAVDSAAPADSGSATCTPASTGDGGACTNSSVIVNGVNGSIIPSYYNPQTFTSKDLHNATVTGLTNDKTYTFGIAATDLVGNVGAVAVFPCGTPAPIDDFWNRYKESGGGAGGTFCALEGVGIPVGTSMLGITFAVAALALARRRRR